MGVLGSAKETGRKPSAEYHTEQHPDVDRLVRAWVGVYEFRSSSRPGLIHIAYLALLPGEEPIIRCSCEGFQMHHYCWHWEWIRENEL